MGARPRARGGAASALALALFVLAGLASAVAGHQQHQEAAPLRPQQVLNGVPVLTDEEGGAATNASFRSGGVLSGPTEVEGNALANGTSAADALAAGSTMAGFAPLAAPQNNTINLQNFTERVEKKNLPREEQVKDIAYGPVDRMRLQGLAELLSHLDFLDLQLAALEKNETSLSTFLLDANTYRNFTGLLSGLDVATQVQIETASNFFADSRCYFPLNGSPTVDSDEWMFYLARRAMAYKVREEGGGEEEDGRTDNAKAADLSLTMGGEVASSSSVATEALLEEREMELWPVFSIICTNETFNIPSWLGTFEWMNDLVSSISTPVSVISQGTLPESVGNLTKLTTLSLHGKVRGEIPPTLGKLQELTSLLLQGNELIGTIPKELGNCSSLRLLWLNDNQLTGAIPDSLANLTSLTSLHLQDNQLTGTLSPALLDLEKEMGNSFLIQGNPLWVDYTSAKILANSGKAPALAGWEIALIVVAAGLATATLAISISWSVRRTRMRRQASLRKSQLEMGDFDDDDHAMFSINRKDLKLVKLVGRGTYGSVFEAKWNDVAVAVKIMNVMDPQMHSREDSRRFIKTFEQEVEYLSQVNHKNIVRLHGYSLASPHVYIVQELMQKNLSQLLREKGYRPDDLRILEIIEDIADGLAYLHPRIVHCDLKPQNILIDAKGRAKIADFGISKRKQGTFIQFTKHTHVPGSVIYMAPECFNAPQEVGEKCDVFSLAMVWWECYAGEEPWDELPNPIAVVNAVAVKDRRPQIPDGMMPPQVSKLIAKCWDTDYHKRPSCAEIKKLCALMRDDLLAERAESRNGHLTPSGQGSRTV